MRKILIPVMMFVTVCSLPAFAKDEPLIASKPTAELVKEIGIDQHLNQQLPLELEFRDETGKSVQLKEYFKDRPVVLNLVYFRCPMLCGFVLDGIVKAMKPIRFTPGKDFQILTISIDPKDTPEMAMEKKLRQLKSYGRENAANGWHFLTGSQASVDALAEAVGFRYIYDEKSKQFAHAGGIMVATPAGRLSHYFYGIEYAPRDLQFALIEASKGKIGSLAEQIILLCFHYDPMTGKYGFVIMNLLRIMATLTLAALLGLITVMKFGEKAGVS